MTFGALQALDCMCLRRRKDGESEVHCGQCGRPGEVRRILLMRQSLLLLKTCLQSLAVIFLLLLSLGVAGTDVSLLFGGRGVVAHKIVIALRCPELQQLVDAADHLERYLEVIVPGVSWECGRELVHYLYHDELSRTLNPVRVDRFLASTLQCMRLVVQLVTLKRTTRALWTGIVHSHGTCACGPAVQITPVGRYLQTNSARHLQPINGQH